MSLTFSRDESWSLFCEWTESESLRRHVLAVEAAMRAYARKFGEDEELWGQTGMLHDLDYERYPDLETGHPRKALEELEGRGYPPELVRAVASHATFLGVSRDSLMEKTLFAVDELSGFIAAVAYVRPQGIHGMTPKSVKKKLKQPSFAAAVNRDEVREGAEDLGVDFDEHLAFVISALEEHADELGSRAAPVTSRLIPEAYRALFRIPGAPRLMFFAMIGRIPIGMVSLAIVLLVREEFGSYATAGGVAAAYAVGGGALAPVQGRLVDRHGHARVLAPLAIANSAALVALVLAAHAEATVATYASAALAGATIPPLSACMRALWSSLLDDDTQLQSAYALEAVATEIFFVIGPLLTAAIAALASPAEAIYAAAVMGVVGTLGFVGSRRSLEWRSEPRGEGPVGALGTPGMRTLVLAVLPAAVAFGTLEVALPAFADERGRPETGGVLLAALAVGSMAGGLWYGARVWNAPLERRYLQLTALFALGLALPPLADNVVVLAVLMILAGASLAPIVTVSYSLIDRLAPSGTATEAYTWVITANVAGAALGTAIAGAVAQHHDARTALIPAFVGASVGFLVAFVRRRTLVAPAATGSLSAQARID